MSIPGGGGINVTEEMREEFNELKHMVENSFMMAQRDYTYWQSIIQNHEVQINGALQLVSVAGNAINQNGDQQNGENNLLSGDDVQFVEERRTHGEKRMKRKRKRRDEVQDGEARRRGEDVNTMGA